MTFSSLSQSLLGYAGWSVHRWALSIACNLKQISFQTQVLFPPWFIITQSYSLFCLPKAVCQSVCPPTKTKGMAVKCGRRL